MNIPKSYLKINIQRHIAEETISGKSITLIYWHKNYTNRDGTNYSINHGLAQTISCYFSKQNYEDQDHHICYNLNKDVWQISYAHFYNKSRSIRYNFMYIQKFSITLTLALTTVFEFGNLQLIPELSALYSNSPFVKSNKLTIKNASGQSLANNKISIAKHSYDLGASLTLATEMIEASIGYERITQLKYLGHTAYLKLRVNI